jgi:hypothetical protein
MCHVLLTAVLGGEVEAKCHEDGEHEEDEKKKQQQQQHLGLDVVVGLGLGGAGAGAARKQQGKQQSPVVGYQARRRRAAVKTVDQDLYHIPPDMLCHEPRVSVYFKSSWLLIMHKLTVESLLNVT